MKRLRYDSVVTDCDCFIYAVYDRRAKKFEAAHQSVIFKTKGIIRGLESLILLLFDAAALLTLKDAVDPVTGFILMAVTFICWRPLQALLHTTHSLDEQGMAYMNLLCRAIEIP